jgi:hypothetical protein
MNKHQGHGGKKESGCSGPAWRSKSPLRPRWGNTRGTELWRIETQIFPGCYKRQLLLQFQGWSVPLPGLCRGGLKQALI